MDGLQHNDGYQQGSYIKPDHLLTRLVRLIRKDKGALTLTLLGQWRIGRTRVTGTPPSTLAWFHSTFQSGPIGSVRTTRSLIPQSHPTRSRGYVIQVMPRRLGRKWVESVDKPSRELRPGHSKSRLGI